ncbi:uncharacterized protein AB675_8201 [Cyphellophora attinorum]|uniref:Uncharacterized protein n=1 Tax=Cyphellophora attinorum TaxID=1664694 RepID=A0A0N0NN77_9EURO|nr:uncharacterized protein AB675_8201 [Phialophora attinorum]KPI41198.1 hypothetical protein AB675_8201 [Phialophora attinorum]
MGSEVNLLRPKFRAPVLAFVRKSSTQSADVVEKETPGPSPPELTVRRISSRGRSSTLRSAAKRRTTPMPGSSPPNDAVRSLSPGWLALTRKARMSPKRGTKRRTDIIRLTNRTTRGSPRLQYRSSNTPRSRSKQALLPEQSSSTGLVPDEEPISQDQTEAGVQRTQQRSTHDSDDLVGGGPEFGVTESWLPEGSQGTTAAKAMTRESLKFGRRVESLKTPSHVDRLRVDRVRRCLLAEGGSIFDACRQTGCLPNEAIKLATRFLETDLESLLMQRKKKHAWTQEEDYDLKRIQKDLNWSSTQIALYMRRDISQVEQKIQELTTIGKPESPVAVEDTDEHTEHVQLALFQTRLQLIWAALLGSDIAPEWAQLLATKPDVEWLSDISASIPTAVKRLLGAKQAPTYAQLQHLPPVNSDKPGVYGVLLSKPWADSTPDNNRLHVGVALISLNRRLREHARGRNSSHYRFAVRDGLSWPGQSILLSEHSGAVPTEETGSTAVRQTQGLVEAILAVWLDSYVQGRAPIERRKLFWITCAEKDYRGVNYSRMLSRLDSFNFGLGLPPSTRHAAEEAPHVQTGAIDGNALTGDSDKFGRERISAERAAELALAAVFASHRKELEARDKSHRAEINQYRDALEKTKAELRKMRQLPSRDFPKQDSLQPQSTESLLWGVQPVPGDDMKVTDYLALLLRSDTASIASTNVKLRNHRNSPSSDSLSLTTIASHVSLSRSGYKRRLSQAQPNWSGLSEQQIGKWLPGRYIDVAGCSAPPTLHTDTAGIAHRSSQVIGEVSPMRQYSTEDSILLSGLGSLRRTILTQVATQRILTERIGVYPDPDKRQSLSSNASQYMQTKLRVGAPHADFLGLAETSVLSCARVNARLDYMNEWLRHHLLVGMRDPTFDNEFAVARKLGLAIATLAENIDRDQTQFDLFDLLLSACQSHILDRSDASDALRTYDNEQLHTYATSMFNWIRYLTAQIVQLDQRLWRLSTSRGDAATTKLTWPLTTNKPHQNNESDIVPTVIDVGDRMQDDSVSSKAMIEPRDSDLATSEVSLHESLSDSAVLHNAEDAELLQPIERLSEDFHEASANAILLRELLEPPSLKGIQDGSTDSAVLASMVYRRSMLNGTINKVNRHVVLFTARAAYVTELLKHCADKSGYTKSIVHPELAALPHTINGLLSMFKSQTRKLRKVRDAMIARSSSAMASATDLEHLEWMQRIEDVEWTIMSFNTELQRWARKVADVRAALHARIRSSISDSPTRLGRHISGTSPRARQSKMALPAADDHPLADHDAEHSGASYHVLAPEPRICRNCGSEFASGNRLYEHLEMCWKSVEFAVKRVTVSPPALAPQVNENRVNPQSMNYTALPSGLNQGTDFSQAAVYPAPSPEACDPDLQGKTSEQEFVLTEDPQVHRPLRHGVYLEI